MFTTPEGNLKIITYVTVINEDGKLLLVEYVTPPNPAKPGWWIPAPELTYGQHPGECALGVLHELGIESDELELSDCESFVIDGAWHFIVYFMAFVEGEITPGSGIKRHIWCGLEDLPAASEFAHGDWERELAEETLEMILEGEALGQEILGTGKAIGMPEEMI